VRTAGLRRDKAAANQTYMAEYAPLERRGTHSHQDGGNAECFSYIIAVFIMFFWRRELLL
jgi:hypothetical protein